MRPAAQPSLPRQNDYHELALTEMIRAAKVFGQGMADSVAMLRGKPGVELGKVRLWMATALDLKARLFTYVERTGVSIHREDAEAAAAVLAIVAAGDFTVADDAQWDVTQQGRHEFGIAAQRISRELEAVGFPARPTNKEAT